MAFFTSGICSVGVISRRAGVASVVRSSFQHVFGCSDLFVISNESDTDTHSYLEFVNVQYILICSQYNT